MLRAISTIYIENQAVVLLPASRRDVFKVFRTRALSTRPPTSASTSTVLTTSAARRAEGAAGPAGGPQPPAPPPPPPQGPQPPRAPPPWAAAAALAAAASLGGVYFYRKINDDKKPPADINKGAGAGAGAADEEPWEPAPLHASELPQHVQYLLVGAGTAAFSAMRAIRAARPDAQVLLVGDEPDPPYMRPPLSKELWREPDLPPASSAPTAPPALSFRQWNGRRRALAYEPPAFYVPPAALRDGAGGAAVARGWRVRRLRVEAREAELVSARGEPATLRYDAALVATGSRPARAPELRAAAAAGRSLPLRTARDALRLARELERPATRTVLVLGGGFLATELSAALAERLAGSGRRVLQLCREPAPLWRVLPPYLAHEAARRLAEAGAELRRADVLAAAPEPDGSVLLRLADGSELSADLVVECVGAEPDDALAAASQLETHAALGGVLVNAELQARAGLWAAGDAACFYDVALGRRRVEHHDHAVLSGRLAGENMAGVAPPKPYTHQSMFWSDLGPQLGYEAIGIIDSRLSTVGVFSADAVTDVAELTVATSEAVAGAATATEGAATEAEGAATGAEGAAAGAEGAAAGAEGAADSKRYKRGVVFYLREQRVVGVLLWNLFNRMHRARQVLAQGEFEDLFEVAKLFDLHEDE